MPLPTPHGNGSGRCERSARMVAAGRAYHLSDISRPSRPLSLVQILSMDPRESRRTSEVRFRIRQKPKRMTKRKTEIQSDLNGKQETLGIHHAAPGPGGEPQYHFCKGHARRARTFIQSCLPTRTASASGVASDRLLMPPNRKRPVVRYVAIFRTARPWSCTRVYGFKLFAPHACIRAAACIQPLRAAQSSARQCCGRCHDHTPQIRT